MPLRTLAPMHARLVETQPPPITMERDLRFHPAPVGRAPRRLTPAQIEAFNRDGFLPHLPLFSPTEADQHRASFDRLLAAYLARGMNSYHVNSCQATCGSVYDLAVHPAVTSVVADLLGDAFACWSTHYFCKLPHDETRVSWHQDAPYWPFTPSHTVTVWLAIDDVDPGNGALQVIPGSHRHGPLPMRDSSPDEKNVLFYTVDHVEQWGTPVPMRLKAGEASVHSDMILHGSPPNFSARRRCAVALRYCTLDVRAGDGWNGRSILIQGSDPTGHWGTIRERPRDDRPFEDGPAIGAN